MVIQIYSTFLHYVDLCFCFAFSFFKVSTPYLLDSEREVFIPWSEIRNIEDPDPVSDEDDLGEQSAELMTMTGEIQDHSYHTNEDTQVENKCRKVHLRFFLCTECTTLEQFNVLTESFQYTQLIFATQNTF